ncbi:hypothetical protein TWF281_007569 [Arthrobotrys megalospora]
MKNLAEIRELRANEIVEEESKRRANPPINISVLGKRESSFDCWTSALTTTITIQPEENEMLWFRMLKLKRAVGDIDAVALYNPQSQEVFYLLSDDKSSGMMLEDIDRLGEEGTVWHVVYAGFYYPPLFSLCGVLPAPRWYTRLPRSRCIPLSAWVRWMVGIETIPLVLIEDLVDGNYFPTWEAMIDFHKKHSEKLE